MVPWSLARDCGLQGDSRLRPRAHLLPSAELTPVRLPGALRGKTFATQAGLAGASRAEPRCLSNASFRMAALWPCLLPYHACADRGSERTGDPPWASSPASPWTPPPAPPRPALRPAQGAALVSPDPRPRHLLQGHPGLCPAPHPVCSWQLSLDKGGVPCLFPAHRGRCPFYSENHFKRMYFVPLSYLFCRGRYVLYLFVPFWSEVDVCEPFCSF